MKQLLTKVLEQLNLRVKVFFVLLSIFTLSYYAIYYFGPNTIEKYNGKFEHDPDLIVCNTTPEWLGPESETVTGAIAFLREKGVTIKNVRSSSCVETCYHEYVGIIPCSEGNIVLDMLPLLSHQSSLAVCYMGIKEGYSTIIFNSIKNFDNVDKKLVLIHEMTHCREFLGHVKGPNVFGFKIPPRKGYVMNEQIKDIGYAWHE